MQGTSVKVEDVGLARRVFNDIVSFLQTSWQIALPPMLSSDVQLELVDAKMMCKIQQQQLRDGLVDESLPLGLALFNIQTLERVVELSVTGKTSQTLAGLPITKVRTENEVMHAWIKLSHFPLDIDPQAEEGLCNLLSYEYLQGSSMDARSTLLDHTKTSAQLYEELSLQKAFTLHQIDNNPSRIYGEGFRIAKALSRKMSNMTALLESVRRNKRFTTSSS